MQTAPVASDSPVDKCYRGRFAPSPTGPLHLGSLFCAVFGWLHARHQHGTWLLRIEDIDPPRELAGASDAILRSLEAHGLLWDEEVLFQHERIGAYWAALDTLLQSGQAFGCTCTRRQLRAAGGIYPGTCRRRRIVTGEDVAFRFQTTDNAVEFPDLAQGPQHFRADTIGDFVIWRKDGLPAYQLAVVVDDAMQRISHVVRGLDLLDSTPGQLQLQAALDLSQPEYLHHPLLRRRGEKLSKQTGARPIDDRRAGHNLLRVLELLGMAPERSLANAAPATILDWALANWPSQPICARQFIEL